MENRIVNYVNSFFEEILYSKKSYEAKEKITKKLNIEFENLLKNSDKNSAFETLLKKYNSFELLAGSVGYTKDDIESWKDKKDTITKDEFQKNFKTKKIQTYIIVFFSILAFFQLLNSILFFNFINIVGFIVLFLIALYFIRKYVNRNNRSHKKEYFSVENIGYFESLHDKYTKRALNWMFILAIVLLVCFSNIIEVIINSSKLVELLEVYNASIFSIEFACFFMVKNILLLKRLHGKIELEKSRDINKELRKLIIFVIIYLIIAIGIFFAYEKILVYNPSFSLIIIFSILGILYDLTLRRNVTYENFTVNKYLAILLIIGIIAAGGYAYFSKDVYLIQPYINQVPTISEEKSKIEYNEENGIYTITMNGDDFKILQLTDIHLGGSAISYSKDLLALNAIYKLISYTKPDLVFVSGDLTFPLGVFSFSFNNTAPVLQFAAFMRNLGIPWAFTYGNHDTENIAITSASSLDEVYKSVSYKTSKNLLYPYTQPDIWGRNNQLIELRNKDGSLNQALFLIDSNAYVEGLNKYDYIHDDQVERYKNNILRLNNEAGKTVSSLVFFHIPLQQYKTAYELYESGSDQVKYFFGSNDEKMIDKVCASEYPSSMFDVAKELGSTKGFFCGHDHYNNMSLEYSGIRLTYGMSIDYLVMPGIARDTKQRGATLITTHKDSSIDIEQIPLTSIEDQFRDDPRIVDIYAKLSKYIDKLDWTHQVFNY